MCTVITHYFQEASKSGYDLSIHKFGSWSSICLPCGSCFIPLGEVIHRYNEVAACVYFVVGLMGPTKSMPHFSKGWSAITPVKGMQSFFCGIWALWHELHLLTNSIASPKRDGHQSSAWRTLHAVTRLQSVWNCVGVLGQMSQMKLE